MKPTLTQMQASDPQQSVWVSASAGTGKTRILVNRMLRLLLNGNKPEKLLCITFTKAAAAEVLQRIQEMVLDWSICDTTTLHTRMEELLDRAPTRDEIRFARRLLPIILQVPGGMKIMTIHAFCQSVLSRFPLEAKIPPGFSVIDDIQSQQLLNQAKHDLLEDVTQENNPALFADLERFYDRVHETNQNTLIQTVLNKRYRLNELAQSIDTIRAELCTLVGIHENQLYTISEQEFLAQINSNALRSCLPEMLSANGATLPKIANALEAFLQRPTDFADYKKLYLTAENTVNKNFANALAKLSSGTCRIMMDEAERCINFIDLKNKADLVKDSIALLNICQGIIHRYQDLKKQHGVLDYEDQILQTSKLLQNPLDSQWVHYKLDGGIDHILVDEAQDTSPAQWAIIKGITEEFFSGDARKNQGERTLFVVGDEKQSIFSFQNADPVEFSKSRRFFADKTAANDAAWKDLSLIENFRSAPLILKMTDQVFATAEMAGHISETEEHILHHGFHAKRAGSVEIWPLIPQQDKDDKSYHNIPVIKHANAIADHVEKLLAEKPCLSNGRTLRAGDIMILVRTRDPLVSPLTKAFKDRNIPVSSADRLMLNEQLAVQDCLAVMHSALHLQDDYTLSCVLKSPFIAMDEHTLYRLSHGRGTMSLWDRLQQSAHTDIIDYISTLIDHVRVLSPGHFIHYLLSHPCPADSRSGRHALISRLGFDSEDILDELLSCAYGFIEQSNPSCQAFLTWMQLNNTMIKRSNNDIDQSRVQIMTAHAAKGLQAAYVFIADAHSRPGSFKSTRDVLWLDNPAHGFMWGTGDALKTDIFVHGKEQFVAAQFSEYYRLLYVALTRAEEHLIICGMDRKSSNKDNYPSWYEAANQAITMLGTMPDYTMTDTNGTLRIEQSGTIPDPQDIAADTVLHGDVPPELLSLPTREEETHRPLRPSRPVEDDAPIFSPLHHATHDPFRRGQILHTLFKLVPDYAAAQRDEALDNLLLHAMPQDDAAGQRKQIKSEVLKVLDDPQFAHLFTAAARAEVPIVGEIMLDGQHVAISGQIDRLLIEDDRVLIVDYKTNRPPVLDESKIPLAYRHQMRAYKALMEKIYPEKRVETALLWTSIPYLLKLSL